MLESKEVLRAPPDPLARGASYFKALDQYKDMYEVCCRPAAGVYSSHACPGRYRADVVGQLRGDPTLLDAELGDIGYVEVDCDQWGASYRHSCRPDWRAELDELPDEPGGLRLALSAEDLTEKEAQAICEELEYLYTSLARRLAETGGCRNCPYRSVAEEGVSLDQAAPAR